MKKYVLPTLVSLTLSSSWVLAEETPTAEPPAAAPPAATQPHDPVMSHYQEMREKRATYMQEMQTLREKIRQATDQEEWQRLRDEMRRLTNEMRQQRQEMREKMWKEGRMMHRRPYGPPQGGYGPSWGGPSHYGPREGYYGRPYGNRGGMPAMPRPDYGMPHGNRGGMPEMPRRDYDMPYGNRGGMPGGMPSRFDKKMPLGHHAKMEQHLENIEKLLEQVVEQLKNK